MRSLLLIVGLIGVAVGGVFWALSARVPPKVEKRAEPVLAVRAFFPQTAQNAPALFLIGNVEALDYAALTSPIEADVSRIRAREGEFFKAGKRLLELDTQDLVLTEKRQQAGLAQLKINLLALSRNRANDERRLQEMRRLLQLAEKNYEREQTLQSRGVASAAQAEAAEQAVLQRRLEADALANQVADYATQRLNLESSIEAEEARLQQTRHLLSRAAMRAPFGGRVAKVRAAEGARVAPGAPLLDIFNPNKMRLRVAIPQRHMGAIKSRAGARALLTEGGKQLTLKLSGLEPRIEAGDSSVNTFFNLPGGDWIFGAVRDVTVELPPVSAVAAPADALYKDQFMYRINAESRAEALRCQTLGRARRDNRVDVLLNCPDLRAGDKVIANHLPGLIGGVKVSVVAEQ